MIILSEEEPSEASEVVSAVKERRGKDGIMIVLCGDKNMKKELYNTSVFNQSFLRKQPLLHEMATPMDRSRFLSIGRDFNLEQRNHLKQWIQQQTRIKDGKQSETTTAEKKISEDTLVSDEGTDQQSLGAQ
ncbi:Hypp6004 [Branchiostoma lanceolatum]|uniref:Hypp6004 protein n=1 Tax=Branchiostoma lanceolatum TaxID=7740 RepID=A0A8J9W5C6_BRALA|nr:Hypp6004 [Branchiostoma lanceolatum]